MWLRFPWLQFTFSVFIFRATLGLAAVPGTFEDVGNTQVSGMMMFLGNTDKVYILDKAQANAAMIKGHSAWGSVWDIATHEVQLMDIQTNTFCSSGAHLPSGDFAVFGGNGAVAPGGGDAANGNWDPILQDFDGRRAIRTLTPCNASQDFTFPTCQWQEDSTNPAMQMQEQRWYSTAEPLANGTIVLLGGFQQGADILRNVPNKNASDGASLSYEFFPNTGRPATDLQFLYKTSGLNAYPHAFLLGSGKMFLQANLSTAIWDYENNIEEDLPDMPNGVIRVYPASGATAMLPMTPKNNYSQTIIFCGGSNMSEPDWGNFQYPFANTWEIPASDDCQTITPEPQDQSPAKYTQDDSLPEGRTMGQFIILPTGKLLILNGALNGTAGYGRNNSITPEDQMPFGQSYASGPVLTPALYDPDALSGQRWSRDGFNASQYPRLYHSSALLLPDGAVLIAGSNPNLDANVSESVMFPTTYTAEKFYPYYFATSNRPEPKGLPDRLGYGGDAFDVSLPASSYVGEANTAAASTRVNVVRPGWTTQCVLLSSSCWMFDADFPLSAMNMGQRFLTLNNTFTVNEDGSIILHVAQMPPNAHIFQPGPALLFVVVNDVPSNGSHVIIGSGSIETQALLETTVLPPSAPRDGVVGAGGDSSTGSTQTPNTSTSHRTATIAAAAAAVVACLCRRKRARRKDQIAAGKRVTSFRAIPTGIGAGSDFNDSQVFLNQSPMYRDLPPNTPRTSTTRYYDPASEDYQSGAGSEYGGRGR
ncbi:copper radical oxidase [Mycena amicta]|nr:copper radical oxidase [Mycena amicta]